MVLRWPDHALQALSAGVVQADTGAELRELVKQGYTGLAATRSADGTTAASSTSVPAMWRRPTAAA
jgi:hypothetical protein